MNRLAIACLTLLTPALTACVSHADATRDHAALSRTAATLSTGPDFAYRSFESLMQGATGFQADLPPTAGFLPLPALQRFSWSTRLRPTGTKSRLCLTQLVTFHYVPDVVSQTQASKPRESDEGEDARRQVQKVDVEDRYQVGPEGAATCSPSLTHNLVSAPSEDAVLQAVDLLSRLRADPKAFDVRCLGPCAREGPSIGSLNKAFLDESKRLHLAGYGWTLVWNPSRAPRELILEVIVPMQF